jgi:hypothetical protein
MNLGLSHCKVKLAKLAMPIVWSLILIDIYIEKLPNRSHFWLFLDFSDFLKNTCKSR